MMVQMVQRKKEKVKMYYSTSHMQQIVDNI